MEVLDERILFLAPAGQDGVTAMEILRGAGYRTHLCKDLVEMEEELQRRAGALVFAESALRLDKVPLLVDKLKHQPAWSDARVVILAVDRAPDEESPILKSFSSMGRVFVLVPPLNTTSLCSTIQTTLHTRRRLEEQEREAEAVRHNQQKLIKRNAELEQRVAQQAAELSAARKELDAFCYSVSHDLRAPLRAIDGFAMTVLEQSNGKLDPTARAYLERARNAAQRMQRLIDDLLGLSRLSRAEMTLERVDLTALANLVLQDLSRKHPERSGLQTKVTAGLQAWGDAALLRIAMEHLLGNAWKFTSRQENACIELGSTIEDGAPVFFVRDNGAGFDMAYAAKLFVPFQRLHTNQEFPGSGIGLSLVQRIIRRHEGEVWAEGWPGKGACIYFRLPAEPPSAPDAIAGALNSELKQPPQSQ